MPTQLKELEDVAALSFQRDPTKPMRTEFPKIANRLLAKREAHDAAVKKFSTDLNVISDDVENLVLAASNELKAALEAVDDRVKDVQSEMNRDEFLVATPGGEPFRSMPSNGRVFLRTRGRRGSAKFGRVPRGRVAAAPRAPPFRGDGSRRRRGCRAGTGRGGAAGAAGTSRGGRRVAATPRARTLRGDGSRRRRGRGRSATDETWRRRARRLIAESAGHAGRGLPRRVVDGHRGAARRAPRDDPRVRRPA